MDNLPRAVFLNLDDTIIIIDDSSSAGGGWRTAVAEQTPAAISGGRQPIHYVDLGLPAEFVNVADNSSHWGWC